MLTEQRKRTKTERKDAVAAWWPLCTARCWGAVDRGADAAAAPSRAARDGATSAPKQTGGRGAGAAAKTSASLQLLFSSCSSSSRTRARSASLREDTRPGIRTGSIRLPVRMPVNRATEWCWCLAQQVQLLIYDWFFVRRRGSTADAGGGGGGGCSRTWAGCGARTAAAARRRCCSAADAENDMLLLLPLLPARCPYAR